VASCRVCFPAQRQTILADDCIAPASDEDEQDLRADHISEDRLALTRPDDWRLHLRDDDVLASVLPDTARRFAPARATVKIRR